MFRLILTVPLIVLAALPASAQRLNLDFPGLADRADEVVDITLDAPMLKLAARFLSNHDSDQRAIKESLAGLEGIYVRSYEFGSEGQYDRDLADRVRSQLGPNWKPFVNVRKKTRENVTIYADMRGENMLGLVIIAAEPREFTVVHINGPIELDRLARLEGELGIPHITTEKRGHRD